MGADYSIADISVARLGATIINWVRARNSLEYPVDHCQNGSHFDHPVAVYCPCLCPPSSSFGGSINARPVNR